MAKPCPSCKTSIKHERGHGDHIVICTNCARKFCFQCLFVFQRKRASSASSASSAADDADATDATGVIQPGTAISSILTSDIAPEPFGTIEYSTSDPEACINRGRYTIKPEYLHYKYSNCTRICNDKCNCSDCFMCSILMVGGTCDIHLCTCFVRECTLHNTYTKRMAEFYQNKQAHTP